MYVKVLWFLFSFHLRVNETSYEQHMKCRRKAIPWHTWPPLPTNSYRISAVGRDRSFRRGGSSPLVNSNGRSG